MYTDGIYTNDTSFIYLSFIQKRDVCQTALGHQISGKTKH